MRLASLGKVLGMVVLLGAGLAIANEVTTNESLQIISPIGPYPCVKTLKTVDLAIMSGDQFKTHFRIPLAYLHANENFKGGDQSLISMSVLVKDLSPVCLSKEYETYDSEVYMKNFLDIDITPATPKPSDPKDIWEFYKQRYDHFISNDEYGHAVYRAKRDITLDLQRNIHERVDFPDDYFSHSSFVTCVRPGGSFGSERTRCEVKQLLTPHVVLSYHFYHDEIRNLQFLDRKLNELVASFMIDQPVGSESSQKQPESLAQANAELCKNANKVLFGFNDANHTQLLIPENYLYDPYNIFHRVKAPAEFIVIRIDRKSFMPVCAEQAAAKDFIKITLKPSSLGGFKIFSENMQSLYPDKSEEGETGFDLYKNKNQETSMDKIDFLIPKKEFSSNPMFMKCSYSQRTNQRFGCEVHSLISDHVRAEYGIDASDFAEVKVINEKIKKIISGFKVN